MWGEGFRFWTPEFFSCGADMLAGVTARRLLHSGFHSAGRLFSAQDLEGVLCFCG